MHGFELIQGQQLAIRLLTTLIRKGQIPHALLFTGIDGIGKQTTARAFAMACNCTDPQYFSASSQQSSVSASRINACGRCRTCRRIRSDNHPDIHHLRPSGNLIRIAAIRDLIQRLAIKPHEQGKRIVIIANAHLMNPEASNALLKILEEPPHNTLVILTARQTTDLLPTIVSRCQQIRFVPLERNVLIDLMTQADGFSREDAGAAAALSGGSYVRAVAMMRDGWILRRRWLAREISEINGRSTTLRLALAEKLAADKTHLPDALEWLLSWYRDLIVFPYQPEKIINHDLYDQVRASATAAKPQTLIDRMKAIQKALKGLQDNANPRLTMESLMLQLDAV